MKKNILFILLTFTISAKSFSQKDFELTSDLLYAYDKILSLEFLEAKGILAKHKQTSPNNSMPYFIENYMDFLTIFISEDEAKFDKLKDNKDIRLDIFEDSDPSSPYHLYTQAEVRLQWAMARIKFKEYKTAFFEISKAYT